MPILRLRVVLVVAVIAFLVPVVGCLLVCRHMALAHYGWALEEGYEPEFVLYTTAPMTKAFSLWLFNGHVQVRVLRNGRKLWVSGYPDPGLYEGPEHPLGEYCWSLNLSQYLEWLSMNKELAELPMPDKEFRDKNWPKCSDLK